MKIVIVSETLVTGGAETFVLRLSEGFCARGESVSICVLRPDMIDHRLVTELAPHVTIVPIKIPLRRLLIMADGFLFRLGSPFFLVRWIQVRLLKRQLLRIRPEVVHSHLITADLVAARVTENLSIPLVITVHGDYRHHEVAGKCKSARIQSFSLAVKEIGRSASQLVCITDEELKDLGRMFPRLRSQNKISKIYNGYSSDTRVTSLPPAIADIPADVFVIGMVARGIREKGWEIIISAFQKLEREDCRLVLVGDGEFIRHIRAKVTDKRVIFTGGVPDPLRYIKRFDVGCMLSYIPTEALPTTIIEYLLLEKPVIATDVGEVAVMLDINSDAPAGLLIERDSINEMTEKVHSCLFLLLENKALFYTLKRNAASSFKKFEMNHCLDAYMAIYRSSQATDPSCAIAALSEQEANRG